MKKSLPVYVRQGSTTYGNMENFGLKKLEKQLANWAKGVKFTM